MKSRLTARLLTLSIALVLLGACVPWSDRIVIDGERLRDLRPIDRFVLIDPVGLPSDDAGDHAFVRQAVPALLGRPVRGWDELKLLADLARQVGRADWVRAMTHADSPYHAEYVGHWSEVFTSRLRVHRETERQMTSPSGDGCFDPERPASATGGSLAACIGRNGPMADCAAGSSFSMGDVLRSALSADRLEPAYRAYLFALVQHPGGDASGGDLNRRVSVGETFNHVYLHRNLDCLGCHSTSSSATGAATQWNRHHPIPGAFEPALYGSDSGRNIDDVFALFRVEGVRDGPRKPWGMNHCGTFHEEAALTDDTLNRSNGSGPVSAFFTREFGRRGSVWTAEKLLREGSGLLASHGLRRTRLVAATSGACTDHCVGAASPPPAGEPPASVKTLFTGCATCHGPTHASGLDLSDAAASVRTDWIDKVVSEPARRGLCTDKPYLVVPGRPQDSCLFELVDNGRMPGASAAQKTALQGWINGLPAQAGCDPGEPSVCMPPDNDNPAAFAYLTAANIVNQVWDEVMGNPLTVANYFPRNEASRDILRNLTETVFVPAQWSLRELLAKIMTSEHFNRRAPQSSALGSAYAQNPVAKPFEVNDPRRPPEALPGWVETGPPPTPDFIHLLRHMRTEEGRSRHVNGVGDFVYRQSAEYLFNATHRLLDWPAAPRATSGTNYPTDALRKSVGQFYQDAEPGFRGVGFQMLLGWEAAQGQCTNKNGNAPDWITRLVDRVQAAPTGTSYTHSDLAQTLRDWLLTDATIGSTVPLGETATEAALLDSLYGGLSTVATAATAGERSALEGKLRAHCGALLQSPQFLLAGVVPEGLGPRPALRECNGPGPCSYRQACDAMRSAVTTVLFAITSNSLTRVRYECADTDVTVTVDNSPIPGRDGRWACPAKLCTWLQGGPLTPACLKDPRFCLGGPPACRPGCASIDCCGGPLPPIDLPRFGLVWAEGAKIEEAAGVRLWRGDRPSPLALERGATMQPGDWLELPPGARLRLSAKDGVIQTPPEGVPQDPAGRATWLQVTGPTTLSNAQPEKMSMPFTLERLRAASPPPRGLSSAWLQEMLDNKLLGPDRPPRDEQLPDTMPADASRR